MKNRAYTVTICVIAFMLIELSSPQSLTAQSYKKLIKKTKSLIVVVDKDFDKTKTLSIGEIEKDNYSVVSAFRDELSFNSFELISDLVSTSSINVDDEVKKGKSKTQIYKALGISSDYYLSMTYTTGYTTLLDVYVSSVQGEIVDIENNGKIVCSFRYIAKRKSDISDIAEFIVSKINLGKNFRM